MIRAPPRSTLCPYTTLFQTKAEDKEKQKKKKGKRKKKKNKNNKVQIGRAHAWIQVTYTYRTLPSARKKNTNLYLISHYFYLSTCSLNLNTSEN